MTPSKHSLTRGIVALASLALLIFAGIAHAQSTWDGGGANPNWGTGLNWVDNQVPVFPRELIFAGTNNLASINNLGDVAVDGLSFDATSGAFTLSGNAFTLGDAGRADYRRGALRNLDDSTQAIGNNITLARGQHEISTATASGSLNLNGTITRQVGSTVRFIPIAGSNIKTTLTNTNGILGGWATIQHPNPPDAFSTFMFAKVDASGNVVPYNDYTAVDIINGFPPQNEATFPAGMNSSSNIRWFGTQNLPGLLSVTTPGINDLNTFLYDQDTALGAPNLANNYQEVAIGDGNTLRFSSGGGIFRSHPDGQQESESLRFSGGTITAGNTSSPAELFIWTSTTLNPAEPGMGEHHNDTINLQTTNITDNPNGGAVTVVKSGPGAVRTNSAGHSFTGGLYINRGVWRAQTNMSVAFGAGDVHVASGAQAYVNADGTVPNRFFVSGIGINEGTFEVGSMRIAADGAVLNGDIVLTADARIGNRGAQANTAELGMPALQGVVFNGKITGNFNLELSVKNDQGVATLDGQMPTMILNNSNNDWGGNTTFGRGRIRVGGTSATSEVIPHGPGKGNLTLLGETIGPTILTLDNNTETVNGLSSAGDHALTFVTNQREGQGHLRVGANDASSTFAGAITDYTDPAGFTGTVRLTKIGAGTLTLTGANNYSGDTRVEGGTLSVNAPNFGNMADLYVTTGATVNLAFSGTDTIDSLFFNGVGQSITGTWGSMTSTADNKSTFFSGAGLLQLTTFDPGSIPGDFDSDGDVDGADLTGSPNGFNARFGENLQGEDFLTWQRNFGRTSAAPAAGAVPEPSTMALVGLSGLALVGVARRRA